MNRLGTIIVPYFGRLPEWFRLFLVSAAPNTRFHWLFFTDAAWEGALPANVELRHISFDDYRAQAGARLGVDLSNLAPYQLCDLRPFFGYLHEDELDSVPYWGFGDVDVILGDLARFFGGPMEAGRRVVSVHDDRVSGHLTFLKNVDAVRRLGFGIDDWKGLLTGNRHRALDEYHLTQELFPARKRLGWWRGGQFYQAKRAFGLHRVFTGNRHCEEMYTTPLSEIEWPDGTTYWHHPLEWEWREGRVCAVRDGREVPYIHFMNYKSSTWLSENVRKAVSGGYEPPALPPGVAHDRAPWEGLERIVSEEGPAEGVQWIRVGLEGIRAG